MVVATQEGATLSSSEWHNLRSALPGLCRALERRDGGFTTRLAPRRFATVYIPGSGGCTVLLPQPPHLGPDAPCGGAPPVRGIRLPAAAVQVFLYPALLLCAVCGVL